MGTNRVGGLDSELHNNLKAPRLAEEHLHYQRHSIGREKNLATPYCSLVRVDSFGSKYASIGSVSVLYSVGSKFWAFTLNQPGREL